MIIFAYEKRRPPKVQDLGLYLILRSIFWTNKFQIIILVCLKMN